MRYGVLLRYSWLFDRLDSVELPAWLVEATAVRVCVFDGRGLLTSASTWLLVCVTDLVVSKCAFMPWFRTPHPRFSMIPVTDHGLVMFAAYQALISLALLSHAQAMTTDPGIIRELSPPNDFLDPRSCKQCRNQWKPPRAHHCRVCRRCVFRMDHHCPWINNCVGFGNQKIFILFLVYTATSAAASFCFLFLGAVRWIWLWHTLRIVGGPSVLTSIFGLAVSVECAAAFIYTSCFLKDQLESIQMNSTLVETYQGVHGKQSGFREHFRDIFGPAWWFWLCPWPTGPPPRYCELIDKEDGPCPVKLGAQHLDQELEQVSTPRSSAIHLSAHSELSPLNLSRSPQSTDMSAPTLMQNVGSLHFRQLVKQTESQIAFEDALETGIGVSDVQNLMQ